jgi:hypothetical protein
MNIYYIAKPDGAGLYIPFFFVSMILKGGIIMMDAYVLITMDSRGYNAAMLKIGPEELIMQEWIALCNINNSTPDSEEVTFNHPTLEDFFYTTISPKACKVDEEIYKEVITKGLILRSDSSPGLYFRIMSPINPEASPDERFSDIHITRLVPWVF